MKCLELWVGKKKGDFFSVSVWWYCVCVKVRSLRDLLPAPQITRVNKEQRWNDDREELKDNDNKDRNWRTWGKTIPVPLHSPQIPYELPWDRTWNFVVKSCRLIRKNKEVRKKENRGRLELIELSSEELVLTGIHSDSERRADLCRDWVGQPLQQWRHFGVCTAELRRFNTAGCILYIFTSAKKSSRSLLHTEAKSFCRLSDTIPELRAVETFRPATRTFRITCK
jgi:hypothetical protein